MSHCHRPHLARLRLTRLRGALPTSGIARRVRRCRGYTLIEMVVVVAIVGILAAAALPLVELSHRRSQEADLRQALRQLRGAIDAYKRAAEQGHIALAPEASGYPATLQLLVDGVVDAKSPDTSKKLYFLRRLPRDPLADPVLPAERTWAQRCHDSPPQAPRPGPDVFDVASMSNGIALDGSRYADW